MPGLGLERGDLLGDGRLRVGERLGRRRERAAVGDLLEDLQPGDVKHKVQLIASINRITGTDGRRCQHRLNRVERCENPNLPAAAADAHEGESQCPPRSSFPTTAPPTRTTPSPSAACSRRAGAEVSLAYVRHTHEPDSDRETLAQAEAAGAARPRRRAARRRRRGQRHVVTDRSTPEGLRRARRARGRRRDRVLLGLAHRQGPRRRRQLRRAPARGRPHRDRDRAGRPRRAGRRAPASSGSSPSATPTAVRARPPRRWPQRSARRSRRSPTSETDLLVIDSRAGAPSRVASRSAPPPRT